MDASDQNPWKSWQAGSAGSHLTDTVAIGDEEVLQRTTTPQYSVPNSDWLPLGGGRESWQELDQLWLNTDMEDHRHNAFGSRPFESVDIFKILSPELSPYWEFNGSQFNGNPHASSEPWKNAPVAGDGGVETARAPGNVGMRSRATRGPSPKRNHETAAKFAQNLVPLRNQQKVEGEKKTGKRHRCPDWTLEENRWFLQYMEVEVQKGKTPWKAISDSLKAMGSDREAKACEDHWGVLLANLKKFEKYFRSNDILRDRRLWPSVGTMSREQRSQNGLPLVFEEEWFEAIARIVQKRSRKHRKCRRECLDGRIHVDGTPAPSSCRHHQSRVCAASSSDIFDNPLGDCDHGISGLVKLLGSTDRNVTVDQTTIEVMKMRLEAKKLDLRRQEIALERHRMNVYQGQLRNGNMLTPGRPPAAHERIEEPQNQE